MSVQRITLMTVIIGIHVFRYTSFVILVFLVPIGYLSNKIERLPEIYSSQIMDFTTIVPTEISIHTFLFLTDAVDVLHASLVNTGWRGKNNNICSNN